MKFCIKLGHVITELHCIKAIFWELHSPSTVYICKMFNSFIVLRNFNHIRLKHSIMCIQILCRGQSNIFSLDMRWHFNTSHLINAIWMLLNIMWPSVHRFKRKLRFRLRIHATNSFNACLTPHSFSNQSWLIVYWPLWNKFKWNLNLNTVILIQ